MGTCAAVMFLFLLEEAEVNGQNALDYLGSSTRQVIQGPRDKIVIWIVVLSKPAFGGT